MIAIGCSYRGGGLGIKKDSITTHPSIVQGVLLNNHQSIGDLGISEQGFLVRRFMHLQIHLQIPISPYML